MRPLPWRRAAWIAIVLAGATEALAAPFYVEGHPHRSAEAAESELRALEAAEPGLGGARVVRRYAPSEGWRYLVHVDDIMDAASLKRVQARYPGAGVAVAIDVETGQEVSLSKAAPQTGPTPDAAPPKSKWWSFGARSAKPAREPSAKPSGQAGSAGLLQAAVAAHGGVDGGRAALVRADHIRFRYRRTLVRAGVAITAEHLWIRSGSDRRLDVRIIEGEGADSTSVVRGATEAWVQTGGQLTERPAAKATELIDQFGPLEMMAYPLGFAVDIETAGAWRGLTVAPGQAGAVTELRPAVPTRGLTAVGLLREGGQVAYVEMTQPNGLFRFEYSDYRDLGGGVVLPYKTRLSRDGAVVEEMTVLDCDIAATVPTTTFDRP